MIEIKSRRELERLRRIALAAEGLLTARPFGSGVSGAKKALEHLGYVQLDTVSVVERAHHHVLHCRVPRFEPSMTYRMLREGDAFEYWTHAAALLLSSSPVPGRVRGSHGLQGSPKERVLGDWGVVR